MNSTVSSASRLTGGSLRPRPSTARVQPMVEHDGMRLDRLMERANVNATTLAEAVGVSDTAVGKWIKSGKIARENIAAICRALGCSSDELLGLTQIAETPQAAPTPIFTKERRASDDVVALQLVIESLAVALLPMTQGSAAVFLADAGTAAAGHGFSTEQGFLGKLVGIARAVRDKEEAEGQAQRRGGSVGRTTRGK